jgi:hypothetical protein
MRSTVARFFDGPMALRVIARLALSLPVWKMDSTHLTLTSGEVLLLEPSEDHEWYNLVEVIP